MIHPIMAQALAPWAPPAVPRSPQASGFDLSGLVDYRYTTDTGFTLRCYLEHEEAVDGGGDAHPSTKEQMVLVYAFAGLIDISEVLHDDVKALIEEEALADLHQHQQDCRDDAAIAAYESRTDCAA